MQSKPEKDHWKLLKAILRFLFSIKVQMLWIGLRKTTVATIFNYNLIMMLPNLLLLIVWLMKIHVIQFYHLHFLNPSLQNQQDYNNYLIISVCIKEWQHKL